MDRIFICIDLKSFYASVECVERKLDPLTTNLVVADSDRTEKTICLAVSPSLKKYGLSGRSRLYEVVEKVRLINEDRKSEIKEFTGKSYISYELDNDNSKELDFIIAKPRMSLYMEYSNKIYNVYLKYLSKDDIYVYSIDEVFCDITNYLEYYNITAEELITKMISDVYKETGITATGGIGTNMYLAKVAMDVEAKHSEENEFGVRIAYLDEKTYREKLWNHVPITDFWRVGVGYKNRLESLGLYTMGDVARFSLKNEDKLYNLFGINAELLIDHAWGYEICTIEDIKKYKPKRKSISIGQVLHEAYDYKKSLIIIKEMADQLSYDLVEKELITNKIVITIGYDIDNLKNDNINYKGEVVLDHYGRKIPKHSHSTINLDHYTSSSSEIVKYSLKLFNDIVNRELLIRRINIIASNVTSENIDIKNVEQLNLFSNYKEKEINKNKELKERKLQKTVLNLKYKYGKNSILKGMNFEDGSTVIDRNNQIGGHNA